jgi:hypothetical protein
MSAVGPDGQPLKDKKGKIVSMERTGYNLRQIDNFSAIIYIISNRQSPSKARTLSSLKIPSSLIISHHPPSSLLIAHPRSSSLTISHHLAFHHPS